MISNHRRMANRTTRWPTRPLPPVVSKQPAVRIGCNRNNGWSYRGGSGDCHPTRAMTTTTNTHSIVGVTPHFMGGKMVYHDFTRTFCFVVCLVSNAMAHQPTQLARRRRNAKTSNEVKSSYGFSLFGKGKKQLQQQKEKIFVFLRCCCC
jgi:hypothetical protein